MTFGCYYFYIMENIKINNYFLLQIQGRQRIPRILPGCQAPRNYLGEAADGISEGAGTHEQGSVT